MNDDNIFRSDLNRNLKISIIAPTTAWCDQVQPMLQSTKQINPDQVLVLDGSTAEPRKRVQEALQFGSDALIAWDRWRQTSQPFIRSCGSFPSNPVSSIY